MLPAAERPVLARPRRFGVLLAIHGTVGLADCRGGMRHASRRVARSAGRRGGVLLGPASPASALAVVDAGCCSAGPAAVEDEALHARLADLPRRHDVNEFAASVKVFAVRPE